MKPNIFFTIVLIKGGEMKQMKFLGETGSGKIGAFMPNKIAQCILFYPFSTKEDCHEHAQKRQAG